MSKSDNRSNAKGRALEKAVALIQEAVLKADPKLAGSQFSIEVNKIIEIAGVRHEIDVLVKTLPGSNYEAIHLFECKNWKKPVDKNEVIVLAAKVNALAATKGFLVARKFTKSAKAQVKLDPRLRTITCTDDFVSPLSFNLLHVIHDPESIVVGFRERGVSPPSMPANINSHGAEFWLHGRREDLNKFAMAQVDLLSKQDRSENESKYRDTSSHNLRVGATLLFAPGECQLNGIEMESMDVMVDFWIHIVRKKLISRFQLESQGRAFTFEPIEIQESRRRIEVTIVQRL